MAKRLRQADYVRNQKYKKKKKELKQRQAVKEGRFWGKGVTDRSVAVRP